MTNLKNKFLSAALLSTLLIGKPVAMDEYTGDSLFGDGPKRSFYVNMEDVEFTPDKERVFTFNGGVSTKWGVSSKYARIRSEYRDGMQPKADGSYMYKKGELTDDQRRALSIFAITTRAGQMYDSDMRTIANSRNEAKLFDVVKRWDKPNMTPIYIEPNNTEDTNNAYFTMEEHSTGKMITQMHFYGTEKDGIITGNVGDSFEAVPHEVGHGLLTRINEDTYYDSGIQGSAFHEGFGDLSSLWLMFDDKKICLDIMKRASKAGGDILSIAEIVEFGEKIGEAIFNNPLRMRNDDGIISTFNPSWGHYDLSLIMSGSVFKMGANAFKIAYDEAPGQYRDNNPEQMAYDVFQSLRVMFMESVMRLPFGTDAYASMNLKDWSRSLQAAADDPIMTVHGAKIDWSKIVAEEIAAREFEQADRLNNRWALAGGKGATEEGKRCRFGGCAHKK